MIAIVERTFYGTHETFNERDDDVPLYTNPENMFS